MDPGSKEKRRRLDPGSKEKRQSHQTLPINSLSPIQNFFPHCLSAPLSNLYLIGHIIIPAYFYIGGLGSPSSDASAVPPLQRALSLLWELYFDSSPLLILILFPSFFPQLYIFSTNFLKLELYQTSIVLVTPFISFWLSYVHI